jgi:hypothetical protein
MRPRCKHCGKKVYHTYRLAARAARKLPIRARVYWHPEGAGYCLTSIDLAEYHLRRAQGDSQEGEWNGQV